MIPQQGICYLFVFLNIKMIYLYNIFYCAIHIGMYFLDSVICIGLKELQFFFLQKVT